MDQPKMQSIADKVKVALENEVPYLTVNCDDNICSNVTIYGSLTGKATWLNAIFHNGPYFIVSIMAPKGQRYYEGGVVSLTLTSKHYKLPKMRAYTGDPDKAVDKLKQWIETAMQTHEN